MRGLVLLVIAGARAAPELVVEVEVNGKMQELRASRHDDPREPACTALSVSDTTSPSPSRTWPAARCSPRNWSRRARGIRCRARAC